MINENQITKLGDSTLLISWPETISTKMLQQISNTCRAIEALNLFGVLEVYATYSCIGVHFDPKLISEADLRDALFNITVSNRPTLKTKTWILPVCYDKAVAPDLMHFCEAKKMEMTEVIQLHSGTTYTLHFYGFIPGFMYLGGLSEKLHLPRKATPAMAVQAGSVAIGGSQTGIYPSSSPGGWHVIGICPVPVFNVKNDPPCLFTPGDQIRFKPVSKAEMQLISLEIATDIYQMEYE